MTRNQSFALGTGWRVLLKDFGIRGDHVLRRAGLPADLFSRPEQGLSTEDYFKFWRSLEAEAGNPMFALKIVEASLDGILSILRSLPRFAVPICIKRCSDSPSTNSMFVE